MAAIGEINGSTVGRSMEPAIQPKTNPTSRFFALDMNGSGGLDRVEFSVEAKKLSEMTGVPLNINETIAAYDSNGNDSLDQNEMRVMIRGVLGPPPAEKSDVYSTDGVADDSGKGVDGDELAAFSADSIAVTGQNIDVRA